MKVKHFFDPDTFTLTYVVYDEKTKDAIVIDPVLDFDQATGSIENKSIAPLVNFVQENKLQMHYILETHAHADHVTAAQIVKSKFPRAKIAVSSRILEVQKVFKDVFNLTNFLANGSDFDLLLNDHESLCAGSFSIKILPTPGHTPACTCFYIDDFLFTGDALFMPDFGTGRCDFPGGSATSLFHSVKSLYDLPNETKVFVGHDYMPGGRELKFETSILESKKHNIQLNEKITLEEFIQFREGRDQTLKAPKLLFPSLQMNIRAGQLPEAESNGKSYLKLPLQINQLQINQVDHFDISKS